MRRHLPLEAEKLEAEWFGSKIASRLRRRHRRRCRSKKCHNTFSFVWTTTTSLEGPGDNDGHFTG